MTTSGHFGYISLLFLRKEMSLSLSTLKKALLTKDLEEGFEEDLLN